MIEAASLRLLVWGLLSGSRGLGFARAPQTLSFLLSLRCDVVTEGLALEICLTFDSWCYIAHALKHPSVCAEHFTLKAWRECHSQSRHQQ